MRQGQGLLEVEWTGCTIIHSYFPRATSPPHLSMLPLPLSRATLGLLTPTALTPLHCPAQLRSKGHWGRAPACHNKLPGSDWLWASPGAVTQAVTLPLAARSADVTAHT